MRLTTMISLLLLSACAVEEIPHESELPIRFESDLLDPRASSITTNNQGSAPLLRFGTFAYHNGTTPLLGSSTSGPEIVARQYVGSPWSYTPESYWPSTGSVDLYAYAPLLPVTFGTARLGDTEYTSGLFAVTYTQIPPVLQFEVDGYAAHQCDLLLARAPKALTRSTPIVTFPFAHALTQVVFTAYVEVAVANAGIQITIDDIWLDNLYYKGSRKIDANEPWVVDQGAKRSFHLNRSTYGELLNEPLTSEPKTISTAAGTLMMMPQAMRSELTLRVSYTIQAIAGEAGQQILRTYALADHSPDWTQNMRANYHLVFRKEEMLIYYYGLPGSPDTPFLP